jgi:hypothetical protein
MCETEGFNVFLEARRYGPLVPPELVSLQIRLHRREELLNLHELRACDFGNLLAILSPFSHDTVEEEDELLGEICDVSASLSREKAERRGKRRWVRFRLSGSCVLTLISFSLVSW